MICETEVAALMGSGDEETDNPVRIVTFDPTTSRRSPSILESLECPLPTDPPWDTDALKGDVRMLLAIRRASHPTCARLQEGKPGVVCSRCLRSIVPWAARKVAGYAVRS